jgi:predicted dehydrogenase
MSESDQPPLRVGVIGVGSMGQNHVRVYRELPETKLVGLYDADHERSEDVADAFGTDAFELDELLDAVDAVSIAVPTPYHYETARECIDAGVDVLVEKPFVEDLENGRRLIEFADQRDVILQVGHIERFNPAVMTLMDLIDDLDIIALDAQRLGPPLERDIEDTAVMDLMIHDLDILLSILDEEVEQVYAAGTRQSNYATATIQTSSGRIGELTASRVTQQKVRQLAVTATEARVNVDFGSQSVEIHRHSLPEYVEVDGGVRNRYESVVERTMVPNGEPLRHELESFFSAVRSGTEPEVTGEDGLSFIQVAQAIERATGEPARLPEVPAR